jgi:hypothetical protein
MQHSAGAWYHLVSFALGKESNDATSAAALLQDAVITVPRCLALRLMSAFCSLFPSCYPNCSSNFQFRYCDLLESQGNVAGALEVHAVSTRVCNSAVAWVHYLSFCCRAVSISSFRYHPRITQHFIMVNNVEHQGRFCRLQAQWRLICPYLGIRC